MLSRIKARWAKTRPFTILTTINRFILIAGFPLFVLLLADYIRCGLKADLCTNVCTSKGLEFRVVSSKAPFGTLQCVCQTTAKFDME